MLIVNSLFLMYSAVVPQTSILHTVNKYKKAKTALLLFFLHFLKNISIMGCQGTIVTYKCLHTEMTNGDQIQMFTFHL